MYVLTHRPQLLPVNNDHMYKQHYTCPYRYIITTKHGHALTMAERCIAPFFRNHSPSQAGKRLRKPRYASSAACTAVSITCDLWIFPR